MDPDPYSTEELHRLFEAAAQFELEDGGSVEGRLKRVGRRSGAALLQGSSARSIMQVLGEGDPLDLGTRVSKRLEWQAILMQHERVRLRALAYVAYIAARDGYRGDPPLDVYLCEQIDRSIHSLLEEDWAADRSREPIDPLDDPYADVTAGADLPPEHARRVTLEFNVLPIALRRPLHGVLVRNLPIREVAVTFGLAVDELRSQVGVLLGRLSGEVEEDLLQAMLRELEEGRP